ncbi:MAG TPA: heavy metal-binding domain-containing protein [Solirubrobacteraceae bacterium]|nr:heavy metal-binding domain-containing protein [Solirubrobacteraceae bacterium]
MPLFGSRKPEPPTEAERRAVEVDLERIRTGGIPAGAEERLRRLSSVAEPFFTSDLSVKEYALAEASGLQPVAQVMGSSVVRQGWYANAGVGYYQTGAVPGLEEPWNLSRDRAFARLAQEADLAGCDGVIGIEMSGRAIGDPGNTELVVFGTGVRDRAFPDRRRRGLGMCTLTGQEVDKLRRIGAEVCGVVGYTAVICVQLSAGSNWVMNSSGIFGAGSQNMEIVEISRGVYQARARAMAEVRRQAEAVQANDIVISRLAHTIEHREYEQIGGYRMHFFYVTMNVLGTALRLGAHPPHPAPLPDPTLTLDLNR